MGIFSDAQGQVTHKSLIGSLFYYRNGPFLKTLGQFENLGFVIMSTRENIRLIARASLYFSEDRFFISKQY